MLGSAHVEYAADWNGRQLTLVRDDLGLYGGDCAAYNAGAGCHPPLLLGKDCDQVPHGFFFGCDRQGGNCASFDLVKPINFTGSFQYLGSFRLPNVPAFNQYLNGRFFDPVFYAPRTTRRTTR